VTATDTISTIAAGINALGGVRATTLLLSNGKSRIELTSDDGSAFTFADTSGSAAESLDLRDQSRALSHFFGLNDFLVGDNPTRAAADLAVRDDIYADPQLTSSAALDTTAIGSIVAGTTMALAVGDNTIANRLAAVFDSSTSFRAAGGIAAVTTTLANYGGTLIARNSTLAAAASERNTYLESVRANLETRVGQVSGVNVDEELANTLLYENAYRASAQMLATLKAMLDELANIV
jgi:flagellar hook-associated protein 1 FlgK